MSQVFLTSDNSGTKHEIKTVLRIAIWIKRITHEFPLDRSMKNATAV